MAVIVAFVGCSNSSGDCAAGQTRVCLDDDTTCTCAPSCGTETDCNIYSICFNDTCSPCSAGLCACSYYTCVPGAWESGQDVRFVFGEAPPRARTAAPLP